MVHIDRRSVLKVLVTWPGMGCLAPAAIAQAQPASLPASSQAASAAPHGPLGDLAALRAIAVDTLRIAEAGDLSAARKRIDDLEKGWDREAPKMKSRAPDKWRALDAAIDRAERELRFGRARRTDSIAALTDLIRIFDSMS
jgi:hypothetical protein